MIKTFKDMMRINIFIFFILLLGLPFCYAANDDTKIMNELAGIKLRYYQLQERLELNIFQARTIVTKLNNYNVSNVDKQVLYDYVTNLTALKNRLVLPTGELDLTLAVDKYVAIKKEAITIVQEFRKKVNEIIPAGDREELRAKLKNQEDTQLALVRKKVGELSQEKNKIIYGEYMKLLGSELGGTYLNSTISVEDARKEMRSLYSNLSDIDKQKVKERLK